MTKREENKLTMYKAVLGILNSNTDILATVPAFETVNNQFKAAVDDIEARHKTHQSVAKGAAQQNGADEEEMIDELVTLGSLMYVYAVQQKDEALQKQAKVTESELKQMRDAELFNRAGTLYETAQQHAADLTGYGVTDASLEAIKQKIDQYGNALEGTEAAAAEKSAARQALSAAFDQADHVLYDMVDPLMEVFRSSEVDFYNQYVSSRVIKDL